MEVEVVGRQTEWSIGFVGIFHQQIIHAPEKPVYKFRRTNVNHQSVSGHVAGRFNTRDVSHRRIWPSQQRDWCIQVSATKQVNSTLILIVDCKACELEGSCFDAERALQNVRLLQFRVALNDTRWQYSLSAA